MARGQATDPYAAIASLKLGPGWFVAFTIGLAILRLSGTDVGYSGTVV